MNNRFTAACIFLGALGVSCGARALEVYHLAPGEKIAVDGHLDDPAWAHAPLMDKFWEISPTDKQPSPVRTEARFAYDKQALYVAVKAYDPDVSQLRAPFARRDNVLADQDMIVLFIDPVGNRKFAHFFRVNPRGSIGDGLYNEDTSNEDFSPDLEFEVVTGRFEGGWTAEFRIPFSSLRYTEPPSKEWSALVFRNYPRDQLYRIASSPLPREQTCFLCLNEPLTGLDDLPSTRHLELTPNITVRSVTNKDGDQPSRRENSVVPSLDVKWHPRPDVIVDATINPDFSQVELDSPQLAGNTQFALFYPEKRPFFLEGADILQAPAQAIYTRSVTDPAWGVRATRRADGFDGTVLVTRDDGGGLVLLPQTYTTDAVAQDFKSVATFARGRWQRDHLSIGGLFTDRTLDGNRGYNRVFGPDVVWFPNAEHRFRAQVLGSWTTAQPVNGSLAKGALDVDHAALADWSFHDAKWDEYVVVEDVGNGFRADNGFIVQNGYRRVYNENARKFLNQWGFNEVTPYLNLEYKTSRTGHVVYQQNPIGVRFGLPRATTVWFEVRMNNLVSVQAEGVPRKRDQLDFGIESNPFPWLSKFRTEVVYGDRLDVANNRIGKGAYINLMLNMRPHPRVELEYRIDNDTVYSRESVEGSDLIVGQRVQQLLAMYHFSAQDSLRAIWQGIGIRRAPSLFVASVPARENTQVVSLVYGRRMGIGKTFYVGANFNRNRIADLGVHSDQLELFAKASWSFDVL